MKLSPPEIIGQVACVTGVTAASITSEYRKGRAVTLARFLAMEAVRQEWPQFSQTELAQAVGRKHHTSTAHSARRFQQLIESDPHFRADAAELNLL